MTARRPRRQAMTLLEVLVALAILLIGIGAITALLNAASARSVAIEQKGQAARLCQSKMAEVAAGAVPLSSQADTPFDEDGDYLWSLDAEQGTVANLWTVKVTVRHRNSDSNGVRCSASQMVLDPSVRGSIYDTVAISSSSSQGQGGQQPGGSQQQGQQGSGQTPGASAPAGGAGAMPKAGGATGVGGTPKAGGTTGGGVTGGGTGTPRGSATPAPAATTPKAGTTTAPKAGAGTTTGGR
ncbi:MAG TPA: type II secretion system protein [Gemmataceae bacterium]|nr:type II secretion system protein [Gemmataceae bacterium]